MSGEKLDRLLDLRGKVCPDPTLDTRTTLNEMAAAGPVLSQPPHDPCRLQRGSDRQSRVHSSGTPALRRPVMMVCSRSASHFGSFEADAGRRLMLAIVVYLGLRRAASASAARAAMFPLSLHWFYGDRTLEV
jgi:hypothetical protein